MANISLKFPILYSTTIILNYLFIIIKQDGHMDKIQDKLHLFGWIQYSIQYYIATFKLV